MHILENNGETFGGLFRYSACQNDISLKYFGLCDLKQSGAGEIKLQSQTTNKAFLSENTLFNYLISFFIDFSHTKI